VRIPLAAIFILVPDVTVRVIVILAAAFSDWLDGWWARTRGPRTRVGALVDPVTDKIFVVTALVAFVVDGSLDVTGLLLILGRDIFVSIGAPVLYALRPHYSFEARFPGKVATNVQIAAVLILTLFPGAALPMVIVGGAASLWASADYAAAGIAALRAPARSG
jgi:CDP-diacylglycerol--glycerol-3-phosphate 3-phosphatidyltransferase/cardiolipin synthase